MVKAKKLGYNTTREAVEDMAAHGIKPPEIVEKLGLAIETVYQYSGVRFRKRTVHDLTKKEVLDIYNAKGTYREIGEKRGLSAPQVCGIKLCLSRKDVLAGKKPKRKLTRSNTQKPVEEKDLLPMRECANSKCGKLFRPEGKYFTRCPECRATHKNMASLEAEYSIGVRGWIG